jgi:hypothetical protein
VTIISLLFNGTTMNLQQIFKFFSADFQAKLS